MNAIVEVVRCFNDKGIINVNDSVDPIRDIEIINIELIMSDLEIVTNRLNKIGKKAEMTKDKKELAEISALNKLKSKLEQNVPARKYSKSCKRRKNRYNSIIRKRRERLWIIQI